MMYFNQTYFCWYFQIGSKKGSNDCSKEYICKKLKRGTRFVVVSTGKRCHRNAVCTYDPDGVRSCVCKTGHVGDGYKVCKRMFYFSIYMNI